MPIKTNKTSPLILLLLLLIRKEKKRKKKKEKEREKKNERVGSEKKSQKGNILTIKS